MSAALLTTAQLAVAKQIVGVLSPPLPTNSAAAFAGNMAQECSLIPTEAGDGGASKYWCQWTGTRLTNYLAWCTNNKVAPTSVDAAKFVIYELPLPDGAPLIVPWLMDASNNGEPTRPLATLTADVCKFYERAGTPDLDNRIAYAEQIAAIPDLAPTPVAVAPAPAPATAPAPTPAPGSAQTVASTLAAIDPTILAALSNPALTAALAPILQAIVTGIVMALLSPK